MQPSIEYVPQLDQANPALRSRLGEAKFLRAFMYFTLVKRMAEFLLLIIYQTLLLMRICN
jgi:hypothetical protein